MTQPEPPTTSQASAAFQHVNDEIRHRYRLVGRAAEWLLDVDSATTRISLPVTGRYAIAAQAPNTSSANRR